MFKVTKEVILGKYITSQSKDNKVCFYDVYIDKNTMISKRYPSDDSSTKLSEYLHDKRTRISNMTYRFTGADSNILTAVQVYQEYNPILGDYFTIETYVLDASVGVHDKLAINYMFRIPKWVSSSERKLRINRAVNLVLPDKQIEYEVISSIEKGYIDIHDND